MKLNRKWLLIVCLVLSVAMATGGTLAYLTDTESETNVMTLGRVDIELIEQQRSEDGTTLEDFESPKALIPLVGSAQGEKDNWGLPVASNYVDKIVSVKNVGSTPAWVRILVAVPAALEADPTPDDTSVDQPLHWNYANRFDPTYQGQYNEPGAAGYENSPWSKEFGDCTEEGTATIDGVVYNVYSFTRLQPLPANTQSAATFSGFYLDSSVDYDHDNGHYTYKGQKVDYSGTTVVIPVFAQAVQANGFENADAAFEAAGMTTNPWGDTFYPNVPKENRFTVANEDELKTVLEDVSDADSGNSLVTVTEDIVLTKEWTPIYVDGYNGADIVTIEGNGHFISGLTAPLFKGGFAGGSGIVIKNLTIKDSEITAPDAKDAEGSGAFVAAADSMNEITLFNCHAVDVTLNGTNRTGGLVGWTSGYSNTNDGPVKSYVTLTNCSVVGCEINAGTESAGGLIGHSGASAWTFTTVTNCEVRDTVIHGGSNRTGIYLGTSNIGETTFVDCSNENVTGDLNSAHPLYGRTAHGTTGKLTIDGVAIN